MTGRLVVPFLILTILVGVGAGVTITPDSHINLTNVSMNFSSNITFDEVIVSNNTTSFNTGGNWSNFTLSPTSPITVTVRTWNVSGDYLKVWNESGEVSNAVTVHNITGLPTNRYMLVSRGATECANISSGADGILDWMYSGGYSTHEFSVSVGSEDTSGGTPEPEPDPDPDPDPEPELDPELDPEPEPEPALATTPDNISSIWKDGVNIMIVVIIVILTTVIIGLLQGKSISAATISDLVIGLMAVMLVVTVGNGLLSILSDML